MPGESSGYRGMFGYNPSKPLVGVDQPFGKMTLSRGLPSASVPLHEAQHAVQALEGFAPGGTPRMPDPLFAPEALDQWRESFEQRLDQLMNRPPATLEEFVRHIGIEDPKTAQTEFDAFQRAHYWSRIIGKPVLAVTHLAKQLANFDFYRDMAGEVEARNVQTRYDLPLWRSLSPMETVDTKRQISPPYAEGGGVDNEPADGKSGFALTTHLGGKPVATPEEGVAAQDEALKEIRGRALKFTPPAAAGRAPVGLMGEEEAAMRQREMLEPPGEWTGGRIRMADGGALEPVDHDPFAEPDRTVRDSDIARAKGWPEPRSPMHDRIAAASQDVPPMTAADILAGRAGPVAEAKPYTPSWSESLGAGAEAAMTAAGAPKGYSQEFGRKAQNVADVVPGLGQALSANQAYREYQGGHYLGAAFSAAGAIPLPGPGLGGMWNAP